MTKNSRILSLIVMMIAILGITTGTVNAFTLGQTGSDVANLQITLIESGFDIPAITSGVAKPGYFGVQTQKALAAYEASKKSGLVLGVAAGDNFLSRTFFHEGITYGGRYATTSTVSAYTTSEKDFRALPSYIDWLPNVNTTITLTATSTHALVPRIGDVSRIMIRNASSTAASSITLAAANANLDLQFAEATGGDLVLNGLDWGELIIIREDSYLTTVIFNEFTEAD